MDLISFFRDTQPEINSSAIYIHTEIVAFFHLLVYAARRLSSSFSVLREFSFSVPSKPIQPVKIHASANRSMKFSAIVAGCVFTGFASCRPSKPLTIPGTLDTNLGVADCDSKPDWTARNFLKEDCYVSVLDMFLQDYRSHPQAKFEFYSSLYPAPPGSNRLQTPKRYTTSG